ncbi:MAG: hypothetical protein OXP66_13375 [Candidatus Tectomicrobia bacterium]|nr:hypothetical protein [Candidatus Tectomicrobia bacterium]
MTEQTYSPDDWLHKTAEKMKAERRGGAKPKAQVLTVRKLLDEFGYVRRGYWIVSEIRRLLEKHNLRTSPDFEMENLDDPISIELNDSNGATNAEKTSSSATVRIGSLKAARNEPVRVAPDDLIARAVTVTRMRDFSQLPVMTTKTEVKGVISWRSIGKAYVDNRNPEKVRDCMEEANVIPARATLAEATDQIWQHDYVLVRGRDRTITGIVTASDLAYQYRQLALPFILIGEIEHHLRDIVRGRFEVEEFSKAANGQKEVRGPDDLTFGDYCRLLEHKESWTKLDLNVDRGEFIKHLEEVRRIRNEVMHFSPDEIEAADVEQLDEFVRFLRDLGRGHW